MTTKISDLQKHISSQFKSLATDIDNKGQLSICCEPQDLIELMTHLKTHAKCLFEQLIDCCGVDYAFYGSTQWQGSGASQTGFSRAAFKESAENSTWTSSRFESVYHLLSITLNQRIRVRCLLDDEQPCVPSVTGLWSCANWYEREAFDLFGITYTQHPDLRRILTDYGFIGHPLRKDYPLNGELEIRYDQSTQSIIYEPCSIPERVVIPKVIRNDHRYDIPVSQAPDDHND